MADDRRKTLEALVAKRKAEAESRDRPKKPNLASSLHAKPAAEKSRSAFDKTKSKPKQSSFSPLLKKQTKKDSPVKKKRAEKYGSEEDEDPSSFSTLLKKQTKKDSPVKKKKRVEKYESEEDEEEENPSSFSTLLKKQTKKDSPVKKKKRVEKYESEEDEDEEDSDGEEDDSDSEVETVKKKPASKGGSVVKTAAAKPSGLKGKEGAKGKSMAKEKPLVKGKRKGEDSSDEGASDEDEEEAGEADSRDEGVDLSNILPGRNRRRSSQPVHYDFADGSDCDDSE